jgi:hypothetical protein
MYSMKTNVTTSNDKQLSDFQFANKKQNNNKKAGALGQLGVQAKPGSGSLDTPAEKKTGRSMDQVMRMPASQSESIPNVRSLHDGQESVYRSCVAGGDLVAGHGVIKPVFQCQRMTENSGVPRLQGLAQPEAVFTPAFTNIQHGRRDAENRTGMPGRLKTGLEALSGMDLSGVRVHTNSFRPAQINALAYTQGQDIHLGPGQGSHLPHEAWHVVQQMQRRVKPTMQVKGVSINEDAGLEREADAMGAKALRTNGAEQATRRVHQEGSNARLKGNKNSIQRYFDASGTKGSAIGHSYRISDDLTAAVKVGYPNHDFYAKAGKVAVANTKLASVGSGIELIEESTNFGVSQGSKKKTLKKVLPKNTQNVTSGDDMKISDDCGTSCAVVVGGNRRSALHFDAMTGTNARTLATTPSFMKAEIMKKMLDKWLTMPSTSAQTKIKINDTIAKADAKQLEINAAMAAYAAATTDAERKIKNKIYWTKVDQYGNIMMSFYNTRSVSKRKEIDIYLKINKFASPTVGQGYTMSSGGTNYPGEDTWNFHWGGVVMKSDDQKDTITLENYAVDGNVENKKWDFAMYGTAAKKGQTFHEQHHDTKQHGDKPTTMTIEKK